MKKILFSVFILVAFAITASAQVEVKKNDRRTKVETPHSKTVIKKKSSPTQKIHNLVDPKHKKYKGVKIKHHAKKDD